jgi:hypothetical protein
MDPQTETPFDSIENAQQYIKLLVETVAEAKRDIDDQMTAAADQMSHRRLQALRLVQFNLEKLERYLTISSRSLNDLRTLRRLLLEERQAAKVAGSVSGILNRSDVITIVPGTRARLECCPSPVARENIEL